MIERSFSARQCNCLHHNSVCCCDWHAHCLPLLHYPSHSSFLLSSVVVLMHTLTMYWKPGSQKSLCSQCQGFFNVILEVLQKSHQLNHSTQKQAWQYWEVLSGWQLNSVKKQEHGWAAHWTVMSKLYIFWHIVGVNQFSLYYFRLWVKHIDPLTLFIWIRQKIHHKKVEGNCVLWYQMTARSSPQLLLL